MLKCIIAFSLILFCRTNADGITGNYDQLVFAQQSIIASFFMQQNQMPNQTASRYDLIQYLLEYYVESLDPKRWITGGLWPVQYDDSAPTLCRTPEGVFPIYSPGTLPDVVEDRLRDIWPALDPDRTRTDDQQWSHAYHTYGNCVTDSPMDYFLEVIHLSNQYNIGNVIGKDNIVPGRFYSLDDITTSILDHLKIRPYVICLPAPETQEQYLLEVQICFDKGRNLVNCHVSGSLNCNVTQNIYYPGMQ